MESRLFDVDPVTGSRTILHIDGDKITAQEDLDVEGTLQEAQRRFNSVDERARFGNGMMHHMSFIPMNVFFALKKMANGNQEFDKLLREWLNDRDNQKFRTRPGRV